MPLPRPQKDETRNKFISRCMSDPKSKKEFTNSPQRLAMCLSKAAAASTDILENTDLTYYIEKYGYTEELNIDTFVFVESNDYLDAGDESEEIDISVAKPGLWENIRKKKEREGKKYRPAKPGDPDRPSPEEIKKAQLVSCPGCMAVTSTLALAPLIKSDLIDTDHIIVDSKIGSSGAGSGSGTAHAMRAGVIRPYKPAKHRHTGEIEQELSEIAGSKIKVSMSPHAVDVVRGILCTNHTFLKKDMEQKELWKIYREAYGDEKFIRLIRDKKGLYKFPDPKFLVGSNFCDIGFDFDEDNNRLIALSASDNLMKGAAGSAIQNMNVMCGFDEMSGLRYTPLTPV